MNLDEMIDAAEKNVHLAAMKSSAQLCLDDAKQYRAQGLLALAERSVSSQYS